MNSVEHKDRLEVLEAEVVGINKDPNFASSIVDKIRSGIENMVSGTVGKMRFATACAAFVASGLMAPSNAAAEGPQLEIESGFMVGLPMNNCPNPFQYTDGRVKMAQGVVFDSHGHAVGAAGGEKCANIHAPYRLGASFIYAPNLEFGEHDSASTFGNFEEEEHAEHPMYRLKLQGLFSIVPDKFAAGPKVEFAWNPVEDSRGQEGVEFQFGVGGSFEIIPAEFHEIVPHWITRFSDEGLESWEAGVNYNAMLFNELAVGVGCLAEGHGDEVHGGCGPLVALNLFNTLSIGFDTAFGPGEDGSVWQHYHLVVVVGGHHGH